MTLFTFPMNFLPTLIHVQVQKYFCFFRFTYSSSFSTFCQMNLEVEDILLQIYFSHFLKLLTLLHDYFHEFIKLSWHWYCVNLQVILTFPALKLNFNFWANPKVFSGNQLLLWVHQFLSYNFLLNLSGISHLFVFLKYELSFLKFFSSMLHKKI